MRHIPVTVVFGIALLTSGLGFNFANAATTTTLSLDNLSDFPRLQGETIIFSGRLIDATRVTGVANATVNIIHQISYANKKLLVSGTTDSNGFYSIPWVIDVEKVAPVEGGSFGQHGTQGREGRIQVTVFARFDGNDKLSQSVSTSQSFEVKLNEIHIFIDKKPTYLVLESPTIKVRVTDVTGNLIDPDSIMAWFDNKEVTLTQISQGVYSYTFPPLSPLPHQFKVSASKAGHISDEVLVTIEGMKRKTSLIVNTDKSTYQQGETVTITAQVRDSTGEFVANVPVKASLISPKLQVKTLTFVDGKATYQLTEFDPVGTWSISANFAGDRSYFSSSGSATFTVEKAGAIKPPAVEEKVSIGTIATVDQQGERLRRISVGQQVMIQAAVTSNFDTDQEIAYISQIKNAEGVTIALSWITGTISPGQTLELAVSWLPDEPGEYTAEIFVWKDVRTPEPLSFEVKRSTIIVR